MTWFLTLAEVSVMVLPLIVPDIAKGDVVKQEFAVVVIVPETAPLDGDNAPRKYTAEIVG
jgi:hypothetical protein